MCWGLRFAFVAQGLRFGSIPSWLLFRDFGFRVQDDISIHKTRKETQHAYPPVFMNQQPQTCT